MMTNLFSTFDPSTSLNLSMNWLSLMILLIMPMNFWIKKSRMEMILNLIKSQLIKELTVTLNKKSKEVTLILTSMFMFVLINNLMGLLPYIFTATSHMVTNLKLALPLWLSIMLFSCTKKPK